MFDDEDFTFNDVFMEENDDEFYISYPDTDLIFGMEAMNIDDTDSDDSIIVDDSIFSSFPLCYKCNCGLHLIRPGRSMICMNKDEYSKDDLLKVVHSKYLSLRKSPIRFVIRSQLLEYNLQDSVTKEMIARSRENQRPIVLYILRIHETYRDAIIDTYQLRYAWNKYKLDLKKDAIAKSRFQKIKW